MKYSMNVVICDPNTPDGMTSDILFKLTAVFVVDPETYGKKTWLHIHGNKNFEAYYDLRYDSEYHRGKEKEFLQYWAHTYWSGKDGAYTVKSLEIEEV